MCCQPPTAVNAPTVGPDSTYPPATVPAHVPFYIAANSSMLFVVSEGQRRTAGDPGSGLPQFSTQQRQPTDRCSREPLQAAPSTRAYAA